MQNQEAHMLAFIFRPACVAVILRFVCVRLWLWYFLQLGDCRGPRCVLHLPWELSLLKQIHLLPTCKSIWHFMLMTPEIALSSPKLLLLFTGICFKHAKMKCTPSYYLTVAFSAMTAAASMCRELADGQWWWAGKTSRACNFWKGVIPQIEFDVLLYLQEE